MTHNVEHLSMVSSWSVVYLLWRKVSVQILCLIFKMVIWFFVMLIVVRVLYSGYRTLIRHMIHSLFCLFFFSRKGWGLGPKQEEKRLWLHHCCALWDNGWNMVLSHIFQCDLPQIPVCSSSQVEMFLLAYAVRHTIQVYRLSKYNTEEFITVYPTDPPKDWPVVTLIAEDDRHYNIPVRVCEETSL